VTNQRIRSRRILVHSVTLSDGSHHQVLRDLAEAAEVMANGVACSIYLYGDERRAIRKAVRRNEEFIAAAFTDSDDGDNPFAQAWPEEKYQILCEEWEYHRRKVAKERNKDTLPDDFFQRLSPKKRALLQVLLDADGEWVRGVDIRQQMREDYDLDVPDKSGAIAIHLSHYTQWYSEEFRRNLIPGRWVDGSHNHAEFRIGDKYEDELREWFDKSD